MIGNGTCQCGDVNLAASLMACGIPLDPISPVTLIESEQAGKEYASWRLMPSSEDGTEDTKTLMDFWGGGGELDAVHPMREISRFIIGKPATRMTASDWMDYAMDWLRGNGEQVPGIRSIDDIPLFIRSLPNDPRSYILAFVYNRSTCLKLYHHARRSVHKSRDLAHVMIDRKLPRKDKVELLARFEG